MSRKRKIKSMATRLDETGISLSRDIKENLSLYKEDHESWDDFLRKVLIAIDKEATSGR